MGKRGLWGDSPVAGPWPCVQWMYSGCTVGVQWAHMLVGDPAARVSTEEVPGPYQAQHKIHI